MRRSAAFKHNLITHRTLKQPQSFGACCSSNFLKAPPLRPLARLASRFCVCAKRGAKGTPPQLWGST
eukprot:10662723-Alexandrium_andersonii.AAC.1